MLSKLNYLVGSISLFLVSALLFSFGCNNSSSQKKPDSTDTQLVEADNVSGKEILARVLDKYAAANSYSDRAVLYLSYRLAGRWVQEPQQWAFKWQRPGQFSAELFNSHTVSDAESISCFVYNIESGNLDNQQLVRKIKSKNPFDRLLQDPIAHHFVGGFGDLPIATKTQTDSPLLLPPTIALLTGQAERDWLSVDSNIVRLADDKVDETECYVLRLVGSHSVDLWIDKVSNTVWQMLLPVEFLDGKVLLSREVTDLQLIARFHEAQFDAPLAPDQFEIKFRPDANPVSQFVKIPESLPSELIGSPTNPFQLFAHEANRKTEQDFVGKTSVMIWAVGNKALDVVQTTAKLAKRFPAENTQFHIIYADSELADPTTNSLEINPELKMQLRESGLEALFDQNLDASAALQIKAIPAVLVLDKNSRIAYARTVADEQWLDDVATAIQRINNGEDIASEMLDEYRQFLESYHQRLLASSVGTYGKRPQTTSIRSADTLPKQLSKTLHYHQGSLQQPGNVYAGAATNINSIVGFDGWQTIVDLDRDGFVIKRSPLGLPENVAANSLRSKTNKLGHQTNVVFMKSGRQAFVYDRNWKQIGVYPSNDSSLGPISDCQLADSNNDGVLELYVAFSTNGVHQVDLATGTGSSISKLNASTLTQQMPVCVAEGKIRDLKNVDLKFDANQGWRWRKLESHSGRFLGLAEDEQQNTYAIQLDSKLQIEWKQPLANVVANSDSRLISSASVGGRNVWCVLESPNRLTLFTDVGENLGSFESPSPLRGFALLDLNGEIGLATSSPKGIRVFVVNE